MEDPPAQQVDVDDENIQDSTISSNSILSLEAVYIKDEFTEEEYNNNNEIQFDDDASDTTREHINRNINLRANIQMFQYPDPNIRVRNENLQYDDNALNLVKIRKSETVVEKSEATSTCNLPETFKFTRNNQLMHFISAPIRSEDTMPIDMIAVSNAYEQNRPANVQNISTSPSVDQDMQQDIERPSTSRQSPVFSNERNCIEIGDSSNRTEMKIGVQIPYPRMQEDSSDDSDVEFQPSVNLDPRTNNTAVDVNGPPYLCDICQVPFSQRCCLIVHIFNIHNDGPSGSAEKLCYCARDPCFECDVCHMKFLHKDNMKKHLLEHGRKKNLTCHFCLKLFKTRTYLLRHLNIHIKSYDCSQCKMKFRETDRLKLHIQRKHSFTNPHKCDICLKRFKQLRHLNEHKLTHSKVKNIKCNVCQADFKTKSKFRLHQKIHEGDKPFCCEQCNKKFSHNSHYITHLRVHSGDKPFECEVCKKKFGQKSILNRHLRIHNDEMPYTCEICQKAFKQNSHLINHKKKVHKETEQQNKTS